MHRYLHKLGTTTLFLWWLAFIVSVSSKISSPNKNQTNCFIHIRGSTHSQYKNGHTTKNVPPTTHTNITTRVWVCVCVKKKYKTKNSNFVKTQTPQDVFQRVVIARDRHKSHIKSININVNLIFFLTQTTTTKNTTQNHYFIYTFNISSLSKERKTYLFIYTNPVCVVALKANPQTPQVFKSVT